MRVWIVAVIFVSFASVRVAAEEADSLACAVPDSANADRAAPADCDSVHVAATVDTIRVVASLPGDEAPLSAPPDALRDPTREPLFVQYAPPSRLWMFADRLNLDKVRWRYAVPESLVRASRDAADPERRAR